MKTKKLIFCWSLVTAGLIAVFWAIWYLTTGEVPVITSIKTRDQIYVLPFSISCWWDILIGPIWSTLIVIVLKVVEEKKGEGDFGFGMVFILFLCLVVSLFFSLVSGLSLLFISLFFSLVFGLIVITKVVVSLLIR